MKTKQQAVKLRSIRQKHAAKAAMLLRIIETAARKLVKIEDKIDEECKKEVGESYRRNHIVGFDLDGVDHFQIEDDDDVAPYLECVCVLAKKAASEAQEVAMAVEPPKLPSEFSLE